MGEFLSVERRGKIAILTMIKTQNMNAIGTHQECQDTVSYTQLPAPPTRTKHVIPLLP